MSTGSQPVPELSVTRMGERSRHSEVFSLSVPENSLWRWLDAEVHAVAEHQPEGGVHSVPGDVDGHSEFCPPRRESVRCATTIRALASGVRSRVSMVSSASVGSS